MLKPVLLSDEAVVTALDEVPEWQLFGKSIKRGYHFKDFRDAFAFMTKVALLAEKLDHHPDWSNSYNKLNIALTTHISGGITALDFKMARAIDKLSDPTTK